MPNGRKTERTATYTAPALEKGLGILELISSASYPMNLSDISLGVGRAKSEIFRMVYVLERLRYVERVEGTDGYVLTNRLFLLGMQRPPLNELLEIALPRMRKLCEDTLQSCHLVVPSDQYTVIIARTESPGDLGLAVRIGHRRPLLQATSGLVLTAFQPEAVRARWLQQYGKRLTPSEREELPQKLESIRAKGHAAIASSIAPGIVDISAPILREGLAVAALTIPYLPLAEGGVSQQEAAKALCKAAAELSKKL